MSRVTAGTWEALSVPSKRVGDINARRQSDDRWGVRPAHSTLRRESRPHGEGAGWYVQPSKETSPGQLIQICDANLPEGDSGVEQKCSEGESEHARRARCGSSARRDLRGGRRVTGGSTSIPFGLLSTRAHRGPKSVSSTVPSPLPALAGALAADFAEGAGEVV